jgi:hypothetical protein
MQTAAAAERERVERELVRLEVRERELAAELASVQTTRAELEHERHVLNHFAHEDRGPGRVAAPSRLRALPNVSPAASDGGTTLRGASIRETAVRVLATVNQPDAPIHYRDWFQLLTTRGFMPAGKNPLATFLTQVGRSPVVKRTTTSGTYVLDPEFAVRARGRLITLAAELAATQELSANATVEDIARTRERRALLTAEIQETERDLDEALRSLGDCAA